MSDLFFNKVAGALLGTALGIIAINKFAGAVMAPEVPESDSFAYTLAPSEAAAPVEVKEIPFPSPTWLAAQDPEKGAKVFKKCASCHNADKGGKNGTGPALWNVFGRPLGAVSGFGYSPNMVAKGGVWDYESLDKFLTKPKAYIPKTKMGFNGLKKETDRAALIAFLRTRSDNPAPALTADVPEDSSEGESVEEVVETPTEGEHTNE